MKSFIGHTRHSSEHFRGPVVASWAQATLAGLTTNTFYSLGFPLMKNN